MLFTQKRTNVEPTSRTTNNNNNNEIYKRFKECDNVNTMWKMIMITKTTWGTNWKGEQKGKKLKLMTKANQSKYGIVDSIKKKWKIKFIYLYYKVGIYTQTHYIFLHFYFIFYLISLLECTIEMCWICVYLFVCSIITFHFIAQCFSTSCRKSIYSADWLIIGIICMCVSFKWAKKILL